MSLPPSLPPPAASTKKLTIAAYTFTVLTLVPILGFVFGLIGLGLGIKLYSKGSTTHGTVILVLCPILLLSAISIATITILTLLGEQLKEVFSQITMDLANQPRH